VLLLPLVFLVSGCADYALKPSAYVYVATSPTWSWDNDPSQPASVLVFRAGIDGKLTLVQTMPLAENKGRPLADEQLVAGSSNALYTEDQDSVFRYDIKADGTLRGPAATISPKDYEGGVGRQLTGALGVDRTGKYLTVELYLPGQYYGGSGYPVVWQNYRVGGSSGYEFNGYEDGHPDTYYDDLYTPGVTAVSGNNQFAYGFLYDGFFPQLQMMRRDSSGAMTVDPKFSEADPARDTAGDRYFPDFLAADSANHLAVVLDLGANPSNPHMVGDTWLASYTIDPATGAMASTNTFGSMPQLSLRGPKTMAISPDGAFVAVGAYWGLQILHFNGALPATPDGDVMITDWTVDQVAWDNEHHLYVLADDRISGRPLQITLFLYTVTEAGIEPVPGSPWNVPNGYRLQVVPRAAWH
jgi:hypothetical protein